MASSWVQQSTRLASHEMLGSWHALLASVFRGIAAAILHPLIIIAFFIGELSSSPRDVALVAVIAGATWYVPNLLTTWLATYYRHVFPVALAAALMRSSAACLIATFTLRADVSDRTLVRLILLSFVAYQLATATLEPAANDLIARSAPDAVRARLFRIRWLVCGVTGVVTGATVAGALSVQSQGLREAFGVLFLTAALATVAESWFLLRLPERSSTRLSDERVGSIAGSRMRAALAVRGVQRLLVFRIALALAAVADPFIVVHGMGEIEPGRSALGIFVALFAAGSLLGGAIAQYTSHPATARSSFQRAALLRFAAPLLAVLIPVLATSGPLESTLAAWLFGGVFLLLGTEVAVTGAVTFPAIFAAAPIGTRGAVITLMNVALGLCAVMPLLGSRIVVRQDIAALLVVAAAVGLGAVLLSGIMFPPPRRTRPKRRKRHANRPRRTVLATPRRATGRR